MQLHYTNYWLLINVLLIVLLSGSKIYADESVVSINLKNNTKETVFWLVAFEETDAMDGVLKERLGNWIPSRVFELRGTEMIIECKHSF